MSEPRGDEPSLLYGQDLDEADVGLFAWERQDPNGLLVVSEEGRTIEWASPRQKVKGKAHPPAWLPAPTCMHLHSGKYKWDFVIDEMARAQIGVGFMLLWDVGPDWGFFGYLGSSNSAWAYDPSTGDVVCDTESIEGGLPRFADGRQGIVSVYLDLPRNAEGSARFRVDGVDSQTILFSHSAVVLPAACLLKESQRVTLAGYKRS